MVKFVIVLGACLFPVTAIACPVCAGASADGGLFYILAAGLMLLTPVALMLCFFFSIRREIKKDTRIYQGIVCSTSKMNI
jgi:hypothetical protein